MIEIGAATKHTLRLMEARLGLALTWRAKGIVACKNGLVVGCVAYDLWTENSVHAHMLVDDPIAWRRLLPAVFRYPFETRGVLLGAINADNPASLRMAKHLGFRETHRIAHGARPDVDLVLIEMRREECRYLGAR